ncbi:MAG TPA: methyltransferase domain-containing protein [Longimicrobiales bacterium]|nr:methyltransferase domain-containing protein [Longimicrobiales bacterium]
MTPGPARASVDLPVDPAAAFDAIIEELAASLERRGIRLESGSGGRLTGAGKVVGRIVAWEGGERVVIEWSPVSPDAPAAEIELRVEAVGGGARVTLEPRRGPGPLPADGLELAGWFASEVAAPFLAAWSPGVLGEWITDRQARRPSGAQARATYRDPLYHYPSFRVILAELALAPSDHLLEVACGGGALLKMALASGCSAAAVDHSADMVRVARELNVDAVAEGRLDVLLAGADAIPFADGVFTCAAMTGVLGFLRDPVAALREIRRVLSPGGRAVIMGSDPELRGTPGAPEPFASRLRFYDDPALDALGRASGFEEVRALRRPMEEYAREAGVPEEHLPLFAGPGARFLLVRRGRG